MSGDLSCIFSDGLEGLEVVPEGPVGVWLQNQTGGTMHHLQQTSGAHVQVGAKGRKVPLTMNVHRLTLQY